MNNQKGSIAVLLCLVLASSLLAIGILTEAALGKAARAYGNSVLDLAGRSVLSEYDQQLYQRYGLFGFQLSNQMIEQRVQMYASEAFGRAPGLINLFAFSTGGINCDTSSCRLTDFDAFVEQILASMKGQAIYDGIKVLGALEEGDPLVREGEGRLIPAEEETTREVRERTLRNQTVLAALPSNRLIAETIPIFHIPKIPELQQITKLAYRDMVINYYIVTKFYQQMDQPQWNNTFFQNEIEYILCGHLSDSENLSGVKTYLIALRTAMNLIHIYQDPEKRQEVELVAALLTPGPTSAISQSIIAGAWSMAEAFVDIRQLMEGNRVPFYKSGDDWNLSLDQVVSKIGEQKLSEDDIPLDSMTKKASKGLSYEDYLFLFLCFQDRETKLLRMMDLIQVNIQGSSNREFAMEQCAYGFAYRCEIEIEHRYLGLSAKRAGNFDGVACY